MRRLALLPLLLLVACSSGGGGDGASGGNGPAGEASVTTLSITSSFTGQVYPVTVHTPAGYAVSTDLKPVLYVPDHELQTAALRTVVEALRLDVIIVSIGNLGAGRRFIDFDLPGAHAYYQFLTREVIPRVEPQLRVDASRRTLLGYSLSGLLAVVVMLDERPGARAFSSYVITDPSLQFHPAELVSLEQQLWDATHVLPIAVYHCSVGGGVSAALPPAFSARGYEGLRYRLALYNLTHATVLPVCMLEGLSYVFSLP